MATARITTAVKVETQKGVAEPSFGNRERRNLPCHHNLCWDQWWERKSICIPPESKNEAQVLGKNIWLFQLQLLRGNKVPVPPVLHCFSWISGRNTEDGHRWLLLSVYSLPFPLSLHLPVLPSLPCSSKIYFVALPIVHWDYFSFSCTEKAGYL